MMYNNKVLVKLQSSKNFKTKELKMTPSTICLNILVCPKFDECHQSDSDFILNFVVK